MAVTNNQTTVDIFKQLGAEMSRVGLKPKMIQVIEGELALNIKPEHLPFSAKSRQQAIEAVNKKSKRELLNLVVELVKELKEVLEKPDDSSRRERPGGPNGIWTWHPSAQGGGGSSGAVRLPYYTERKRTANHVGILSFGLFVLATNPRRILLLSQRLP
jgi:hypothetical protein